MTFQPPRPLSSNSLRVLEAVALHMTPPSHRAFPPAPRGGHRWRRGCRKELSMPAGQKSKSATCLIILQPCCISGLGCSCAFQVGCFYLGSVSGLSFPPPSHLRRGPICQVGLASWPLSVWSLTRQRCQIKKRGKARGNVCLLPKGSLVEHSD